MMHLLQNKTLVNGKWVGAAGNKQFDVINPATGQVIGKCPDMDVSDAENAVQAAYDAYYSPKWQGLTAKDRSNLLKV